MKDLKKLYQKAIDKWGFDSQITIAIEELLELATALLKRDRLINGSKPEEIIDEIVDVEICLGQLKYIYNFVYPSIDMKLMRDLKLARFKTLLDRGDKKRVT